MGSALSRHRNEMKRDVCRECEEPVRPGHGLHQSRSHYNLTRSGQPVARPDCNVAEVSDRDGHGRPMRHFQLAPERSNEPGALATTDRATSAAWRAGGQDIPRWRTQGTIGHLVLGGWRRNGRGQAHVRRPRNLCFKTSTVRSTSLWQSILRSARATALWKFGLRARLVSEAESADYASEGAEVRPHNSTA